LNATITVRLCAYAVDLATADDRVDTVALEHRSEIERNLLVKKNAH